MGAHLQALLLAALLLLRVAARLAVRLLLAAACAILLVALVVVLLGLLALLPPLLLQGVALALILRLPLQQLRLKVTRHGEHLAQHGVGKLGVAARESRHLEAAQRGLHAHCTIGKVALRCHWCIKAHVA